MHVVRFERFLIVEKQLKSNIQNCLRNETWQNFVSRRLHWSWGIDGNPLTPRHLAHGAHCRNLNSYSIFTRSSCWNLSFILASQKSLSSCESCRNASRRARCESSLETPILSFLTQMVISETLPHYFRWKRRKNAFIWEKSLAYLEVYRVKNRNLLSNLNTTEFYSNYFPVNFSRLWLHI